MQLLIKQKKKKKKNSNALFKQATEGSYCIPHEFVACE